MVDRRNVEPEAAVEPPLDAAKTAALGWFTRLKTSDSGAEDRAAFEVWLAADPSHVEAYAAVAALWDDEAFAGALRRHERRTPVSTQQRPRRPWWAAAAAALVLAVGIASTPDVIVAVEADVRTGTGTQARVELPDGSTVVLNSASAVAVDFTPARRGIRLLAGEAYFDVAPDPDRPFDVSGADATARAVGTAYAVRTDGDRGTVTVRHGRVTVAGDAEPARQATLGAGQQLTIDDGRLGIARAVDADDLLAWVEGRFVFHNRRLGDVLAELDRHHAGWIVLADDRLRDFQVSGNYRLDDPVAVAVALAAAVGADAHRVSNYLLILR